MIQFSIITVTYNAGAKLKETVTSILEQTYDNYEIVIKDGLSTDGSLNNLPDAEKIRLERCKDNGIYDAMNQAVALARGEYIIFMNCGDFFYDKEVLSNIAKCIEHTPDRGIYYGDAYFALSKEVIHMPREITDFVCYRHIPCHQACVFAKELFADKAFDLQYKIRADYEFFLRQYYIKAIRPVYTEVVIANYEGGGFSENKENRKWDKQEHRMITRKYMKKSKLFLYRMIMLITLQPIRHWLAQKSCFAGMYDGIKRKIYGIGK